MRIASTALGALAAMFPLWAQEIKLPGNLDKLAEKAEESVVVTLDKSMLRLASGFLDHQADEAEFKKLMAGVDSIYVRCFEFANNGEYSAADVEAVRAQLQAPVWSRIVGVRSRRTDGDVDVYLKNTGNGHLGGIVLICVEPRELTVVAINGMLDPERLVDLGGEFGIPKLTARRLRREEQ